MSDYQPMTCLPVLALRGLVVFPGCVTHFDVGRTKSVRSVEEAMRANQTIFLVASAIWRPTTRKKPTSMRSARSRR